MTSSLHVDRSILAGEHTSVQVLASFEVTPLEYRLWVPKARSLAGASPAHPSIASLAMTNSVFGRASDLGSRVTSEVVVRRRRHRRERLERLEPLKRELLALLADPARSSRTGRWSRARRAHLPDPCSTPPGASAVGFNVVVSWLNGSYEGLARLNFVLALSICQRLLSERVRRAGD